MLLMIVAATYKEFQDYRKTNFIYFKSDSSDLGWVNGSEPEHQYSTYGAVERGSPYIHLSGKLSLSMKLRYQQVQLVKQ